MLDDLLSQFEEYLKYHLHRQPSTCMRYGITIRKFLTHCIRDYEEDIPKITANDIDHYIGRLRAKHKSINTQRVVQTAIRMFFNWYSNLTNNPNPARDLAIIREEIKIPDIPSLDDITNMISIFDVSQPIGRRNAGLLSLLTDTGIRISEAAKLKVGNVRLMEKNFILNVPRIKGFERQVPFGLLDDKSILTSYWLVYYLDITANQRWGDNEPLFKTIGVYSGQAGKQLESPAMREIIKRAAKKAKIRIKVTPHSFRHFYGTYSVLNGIDIIRLKELLGHALLETTMRYVHISNFVDGRILEKTASRLLPPPPPMMRGWVKLVEKIPRKIR